MYFDPVPVMIGMLFLMGLTALLLVAHLGWLIVLWERLNPFGPTLPGLSLFILALLTPVVSFYTAMVIDRRRGTAPPAPATEWWRWLLPVLSLVLIALMAARAEARYAPEYRRLDHGLEIFWLMLAYPLAVTAVLHMAATVFGITRRPPWTSHVQLAFPLLLVLLAAP